MKHVAIFSSITFHICVASVVFNVIVPLSIFAQSEPPGEGFPPAYTAPTSPLPPEFQSSINVSVLGNIPGDIARIRSIRVGDSLRLIVFPREHVWKFYNLDATNQLKFYGELGVDSNATEADFETQDIETITYADSSVRMFLDMQRNYDKTAKIISIPLDSATFSYISSTHGYFKYSDIVTARADVVNSIGVLEMLHQFDGRLFLATNTSRLIMYDVSDSAAFTRSFIDLNPSLPTLHHPPREPIKIHEVKGFNRQNGERLIGMGLPRYGMCVLTFDSLWNKIGEKYQYYEFDRTLFPDTVINPNKAYYDPVYNPAPNSMRNHKWDWNICHSVLPYDDQGGRYVLVVDEYTSYPAYKDAQDAWILSTFEKPDFYMPDTALHPLTHTYGYFNRQQVTSDTSVILAYTLQDSTNHILSICTETGRTDPPPTRTNSRGHFSGFSTGTRSATTLSRPTTAG